MDGERDLRLMLAQAIGALDEQGRRLAGVEARLAFLHEELRRQGETVARLKLMADNARARGIAQSEALAQIGALLDGKGGRS